jgi:glycerol-3-phosphate O-acyltransferase/dihydroxyacetone phosphate acyltransferase
VLMNVKQDHPELLAPVDYSEIRHLTARMHREISSGTLDSPSWELIRTAKLAATMYAPLGTKVRHRILRFTRI